MGQLFFSLFSLRSQLTSEALSVEVKKETTGAKKARRRAPTAPIGNVRLVKVKGEPAAKPTKRRPAPLPPRQLQGDMKSDAAPSPSRLRQNRPIPPPPSIPCPPPPVKPRSNLPGKESPLVGRPNQPAPEKPSPIPAQRRKIEIVRLTNTGDGPDPKPVSNIQSSNEAERTSEPTKQKPADEPPKDSVSVEPQNVSPQVNANSENTPVVVVQPKADSAQEKKLSPTVTAAKPGKPATKPKPALKPKPKLLAKKQRKETSSPSPDSAKDPHRLSKSQISGPILEGTDGAGDSKGDASPKPVAKPRPPPREHSTLSSTAVNDVGVSSTSVPTEQATTQNDPVTQDTPKVESDRKEPLNSGVGKVSDSPKTTKPTSSSTNKSTSQADTGSPMPVSSQPVSKGSSSPKPTPPAKPSPPLKPAVVVKSPSRAPPAPPGSKPRKNIVVPQQVKVVRPVRPPAPSKQGDPVKEPTPTVTPVNTPPPPVEQKVKPQRPPPPRSQNVPNTSTFFPTPAPRKNNNDSVRPPSEVEPATANLRRVISPYTKEENEQLSLKLGDCVSEIKPANKEGFCYGMLDNGQTGFYPSDCVEAW